MILKPPFVVLGAFLRRAIGCFVGSVAAFPIPPRAGAAGFLVATVAVAVGVDSARAQLTTSASARILRATIQPVDEDFCPVPASPLEGNGSCTAVATTTGWIPWGRGSSYLGIVLTEAGQGSVGLSLVSNCRGDGGRFFGDAVRATAFASSSGLFKLSGPPGEEAYDVLMRYKASAVPSGTGRGQISFSVSLSGGGIFSSSIGWRTTNCTLVEEFRNGQAFEPYDPDSPLWMRWNATLGGRSFALPGPLPSGEYRLTFTLDGRWDKGGEHACGGYPNAWETSGTLDAGRTVTLATEGPVFVLPPGWTVDSADFNIVDNHWLGSTTFPVIMSQPEPEPVGCQSRQVHFELQATGQAPLAYQWRLDGTDLPGATEPALTISVPAATDVGIYECVVSNILGAALSHPVPLFLCIGDVDCDGDTDLADFAVTQVHYGTANAATPDQGDLEADGDVDVDDARHFVEALTGPWDGKSLGICDRTPE